MAVVETLAYSLVREYLSRKGWKRSLSALDEESPRRGDGISSRQALAKAANIEGLVKRNKERDMPLRTMIEVMALYFIEDFSIHKQSSLALQSSQISSQTTDPSEPMTSSRVSHPPPKPLSAKDQIKSKPRQSEETEVLLYGKSREFQTEGSQSVEMERMRKKSTNIGVVTSTRGDVKVNRRHVGDEKRKDRLKGKPFLGRMSNEWGVDFTGSRTESGKVGSVGDGGRDEAVRHVGGEVTSGGRKDVRMKEQKVSRVGAGKDSLLFEDIEDEEFGGLSVTPKPTLSLTSSIHGQPLDMNTAIELKSVLFGSGTSSFNSEWQRQSFTFCDLPGLEYGLIQIKGGPCGVLASVQAFVVKQLLFGAEDKKWHGRLEPGDAERREALCLSVAEILWKCGAETKACVVRPSVKMQFAALPGRYKADRITEYLSVFKFTDRSTLEQFTRENINQFENSSGNGVILFLYSALLSRGLEQIRKDMDEASNRLMGMHGYCNQEMVNLLLTGVASSNAFNNYIELDAGGSTKLILKGIQSQSDVGFLSLFEHYNSCQVGSYLKSPVYPVWVVCSESHFSVLFSTERELLSDWKLGRRFDLFYYDGLAHQDEVIRLTINTTKKANSDDTDLIPPLEHCIRTRWPDASVNWNGSEPIL